MKVCQHYLRVIRLCSIVHTIDEGEGVENEVDEGEPEQRSYLCLDLLSLGSRLLIVET